MRTEFNIEELSEEEQAKPDVLQKPDKANVLIQGEMKLVDRIVAVLKREFPDVY